MSVIQFCFVFQPSGSHRGSKTNLASELETEEELKVETEGKLKVIFFKSLLRKKERREGGKRCL